MNEQERNCLNCYYGSIYKIKNRDGTTQREAFSCEITTREKEGLKGNPCWKSKKEQIEEFLK